MGTNRFSKLEVGQGDANIAHASSLDHLPVKKYGLGELLDSTMDQQRAETERVKEISKKIGISIAAFAFFAVLGVHHLLFIDALFSYTASALIYVALPVALLWWVLKKDN
jgi:hypothetical protein